MRAALPSKHAPRREVMMRNRPDCGIAEGTVNDAAAHGIRLPREFWSNSRLRLKRLAEEPGRSKACWAQCVWPGSRWQRIGPAPPVGKACDEAYRLANG